MIPLHTSHFRLLLFVLLSTLLARVPSACKSGQPDAAKSSPAVTGVADSVLARQIDLAIDSVSQRLDVRTKPPHLPVSLYAIQDSMYALLADGKDGQVHAKFHPANAQVWPTYYFIGKKIARVRFREWWNQDTTPFIRESMIYYRDGKPFYCEERSMTGNPGDQPVLLRDLPFEISPRLLPEITDTYETFWPILIKVSPALADLEHP